MTKNEHLVDTIILVQNRSAMLLDAVQSVPDQTCRSIKVVIVDDGPTDHTPQVADALAALRSDTIRMLRQKNARPGPARQAGHEASRSEFLQALDSDVLLKPDKFRLGNYGDMTGPASFGVQG